MLLLLLQRGKLDLFVRRGATTEGQHRPSRAAHSRDPAARENNGRAGAKVWIKRVARLLPESPTKFGRREMVCLLCVCAGEVVSW